NPDEISIHGRVQDPGGKPVPDADVFLTRPYWDDRASREALARTHTDATGAFSFSYVKSDPRFRVDVERPELWRHVTVVAFAAGYGPGWQDRSDVSADQEAVLSLAAELPLRGRVLDLEGRPVAGVRVRVNSVQAFEPENLDPWLASLQRGVKAP